VDDTVFPFGDAAGVGLEGMRMWSGLALGVIFLLRVQRFRLMSSFDCRRKKIFVPVGRTEVEFSLDWVQLH